MSFERSRYDVCAYGEQVKRYTGPVELILSTPDSGHSDISGNYLTGFQMGRSSRPQGTHVDVENLLSSRDRPLTACFQQPSPFQSDMGERKKPIQTTEDTRLSHPPCTLRGAGINRFHPTCSNPQELCKIQPHTSSLGVSSRRLAKDNHISCEQDKRVQQLLSKKYKKPEKNVNFASTFTMNTSLPSHWIGGNVDTIQFSTK